MEFLEENIDAITQYVRQNKTYQEISMIFKEAFPEQSRGFSERNIRLFCSKHGIRRMDDAEVDDIVQGLVDQVSRRHQYPRSSSREVMSHYN